MFNVSNYKSHSTLVLVHLARRRVSLGFLVGILVLWLADPNFGSLVIGSGFSLVGESLRFWAAGHLKKYRGLTTSGPYRWTRHPLYLGSSIIGIGFVIASDHLIVAALVGLYLVTTLAAAIHTEDRVLHRSFGKEYEDYRKGRAVGNRSHFSLACAWANREYRAVFGLLMVISVLVAKVYAT